jgi:hypothetical protein
MATVSLSGLNYPYCYKLMSIGVKYQPRIPQRISWDGTMILAIKLVKANGQKFLIKSVLFFLKNVKIEDAIFVGR